MPARPVLFFQAEDGIRDSKVTGVQTCALPILLRTFGGFPTVGVHWPERWLSGLRHTPGKRAWAYTPPWVQIPVSPPISNPLFAEPPGAVCFPPHVIFFVATGCKTQSFGYAAQRTKWIDWLNYFSRSIRNWSASGSCRLYGSPFFSVWLRALRLG